jgi:hypothetical protein
MTIGRYIGIIRGLSCVHIFSIHTMEVMNATTKISVVFLYYTL